MYCLLTLVFMSINLCAQDYSKKSNIIVDTATYTICDYSSLHPSSQNKSFKLTENDLRVIDELFRKRIVTYHHKVDSLIIAFPKVYKNRREEFIIYPNKYMRYYLPYINDENEKIVFINCVCFEAFDKPLEWESMYITMSHDKCNYSFEINITDYTYGMLCMDGSCLE